jgi:hypothetical protein
MRNAIFYLTYNGLYNFTNGIGTQTQLLISGLEVLREMLVRQYGPIDVHMVCPSPDAHTWGYDHAFFQRQQERLAPLGGRPSVRTSHRCCIPKRRPMSGH